MNLKQSLKGKIPDKELEQLHKSFDIIGDVAVLDIPEGLKKRKRLIVRAVLERHKHVRTVLNKASERKGRLRLRKFNVWSGRETETVHKEYGYHVKLDVRTCYFSPREAEERQRVAGQVKPDERVLVLFAGVGPYAIAIAKRQPLVHQVDAVELNPQAAGYIAENARLNNVDHLILPLCGNAKGLDARFFSRYDRVVMPLPKDGYRFLEVAIHCLKRNGILHFSCIEPERSLFTESVKLAAAAAKKQGRLLSVQGKRKVLLYGPRTWKVCLDCLVT